ncbi:MULTISPECIES: LacI family DNA-binding transcriptional regulator [unclassified Nocardioides]|uniref:LacI family DNA-binding transcriptional regulator n=1 Tax=unclassified Nocardioides TaxID=2615069 RepID=UPI003014C871
MGEESDRRPPRMDDVAKRAGVSVGTVSHVLNHPERVASRTLDRVNRAIEELGFVPDRRARALAGGSSALIGFVVLDLTNSYFVDMARGAEEEAQLAGMNVVLANSDLQAAKELTYLHLFDEERVAGILLTPLARRDEQAWRSAGWRGELVILNTEAEPDRCSVVPDDELGGYLAARHLIEVGRRNLVFAGGLFGLAPVANRLRGAERAVAETNGAVRMSTVVADGLRPHHGREIGRGLAELSPADRPDGVVAAADLLALGIVQSLAGDPTLRIPDDLSVVGYDNNQASWESEIPLTTIAQPGHAIGQTAARLLIDEIRHPATHLHQHVRIDPQLIVRGSSVPASGR